MINSTILWFVLLFGKLFLEHLHFCPTKMMNFPCQKVNQPGVIKNINKI